MIYYYIKQQGEKKYEYKRSLGPGGWFIKTI